MLFTRAWQEMLPADKIEPALQHVPIERRILRPSNPHIATGSGELCHQTRRRVHKRGQQTQGRYGGFRNGPGPRRKVTSKSHERFEQSTGSFAAKTMGLIKRSNLESNTEDIERDAITRAVFNFFPTSPPRIVSRK